MVSNTRSPRATSFVSSRSSPSASSTVSRSTRSASTWTAPRSSVASLSAARTTGMISCVTSCSMSRFIAQHLRRPVGQRLGLGGGPAVAGQEGDALGDDLEPRALLARRALPPLLLEPALDGDRPTLLAVGADDLGLLVPGRDVDERGLLLPVAVDVEPAPVQRQPEVADRLAGRGVPDSRGAGQ